MVLLVETLARRVCVFGLFLVSNSPGLNKSFCLSICLFQCMVGCSLGVGLFMTMSSDHENAVKEHYVYEFSAKLQYGGFFLI